MQVIIAPNSFKGSLDAFSVAVSIEKGLSKSKLNVSCSLFPIADGGDHTLEVFHSWMGGTVMKKKVHGPFGENVIADWLYIAEEKTAVIEMAKCSGISLVDKSMLNPLNACSFGTGQLIMEAAHEGAKTIILGLGGSATVDGGLGILQALGAKLFDKNQHVISNTTNPLLDLENLSIEKLDPLLKNIEFIILCDVENPLLGPNGAAHVFGPQKGATKDGVEKLEKSMAKMDKILSEKTGVSYSNIPGSGAAGGIAVSLKSFFNTSMVSGVDFLLEKMSFVESISNADLLITAEGKVDSQTLHGKGPYGVSEKAKKYGIPCIILAGKADDIDKLNHGFDAVFPITNGPGSLENAMRRTAKDLEVTAKQIGNLLAIK